MLLIPGFFKKYDIQDLVSCIAPRKLLLVSASKDKYSIDADKIYSKCKKMWRSESDKFKHFRYAGGNELDKSRYKDIINWVSDTLGN